MATNSLIGLVLCGGQSSRMKTDKGLIQNQNATWAQIAFEKLQTNIEEVFVSVNHSQSEDYLKIFKEKQLIFDNQNVAIKGPLLGLLSAHLQFPDNDILVLACDIVNIKENTIRTLIDNFHNQTAICYSFNSQTEPLVGIYSATALKQIHKLYLNNNLLKYSMMHVLEITNAELLPLTEKDFLQFKNYNSPEDIVQ